MLHHCNELCNTPQREKSAALFCYTTNHSNYKYLVGFVFCEVLGTVIAIGNLFLTNVFLGGKFFYYGQDALAYLRSDITDANNPLNQVFPKVRLIHYTGLIIIIITVRV